MSRNILSDEEEEFAQWLKAVAEVNGIDFMNEGMKDRVLDEEVPDAEED